MAVRNLSDITNLRGKRDELQRQLALFEASQSYVALHPLRAASATRQIRRAIAEYDRLISRCRPLKAHKDENLHLF